MNNEKVIEEFFAAFARRDGEAMARHYHPDVSFEDPVFGKLSHPEVAAMWSMLCSRAKDLVIELRSHTADDETGGAEWDAKYTFSKTGKFVHNKIRSKFVFRDGLIIQQEDDFDFWRWASMAFGPRGRLFGWSSVVQSAVRKDAKRSLARYQSAGE